MERAEILYSALRKGTLKPAQIGPNDAALLKTYITSQRQPAAVVRPQPAPQPVVQPVVKPTPVAKTGMGYVREAELKPPTEEELTRFARPYTPPIEKLTPEQRVALPAQSKILPSLTAGVGDVIATAGGAAKWLGAKKTGERLVAKGEEMRKAHEIPTEEFSWKQLLDPNFYTTNVMRSVPFSVALIPVAVAGAYGLGTAGAAMGLGAFGKAVLGAVGGGLLNRAVEGAMEAGGTYNEALQMGMTEEQADKAAQQTFKKNLALAGMDIGEFATAFVPIPGAKTLGKAGKIALGAGRLAATAGQEAVEEGVQEVIQRRSLGETAPVSELLKQPQTQEAMTIGAIHGGGLGAAGTAFTEIKSRVIAKLPPDVQGMVNTAVKQMEAAGVPKDRAEVQALDAVAETPQGQKAIQDAVNEVKETAEAKPEAVKPTPPVAEAKPAGEAKGEVGIGVAEKGQPISMNKATGTIQETTKSEGMKEPWQMTKAQLYTQGLDEGSQQYAVRRQKPLAAGTYYHVTTSAYKGGDILSSEELGLKKSKWKDFEGYVGSEDWRNVALFDSLAEAERFKQDFLKGRGKILEVSVPEEAIQGKELRRNSEGYATIKSVPAEWVTGQTSHKAAIQRALKEGKPVPPEVLKEYPDLAGEAKGEVAAAKNAQAMATPAAKKKTLFQRTLDAIPDEGPAPRKAVVEAVKEITHARREAVKMGYAELEPSALEQYTEDVFQTLIDKSPEADRMGLVKQTSQIMNAVLNTTELTPEKIATLPGVKAYLKERPAKPEPPKPLGPAPKGETKADLSSVLTKQREEAVGKVEAELGSEVDKVIEEISPPVGLSIKVTKNPPPTKGEGFKFSDAATEARYQRAHEGVQREGFWTQIQEIGRTLRNKALREYEHLPRTGEFAPLRYSLLDLTKQKGVSGDRTVRLQQGIISKMLNNPTAFNLFERKVLLDDLVEEMEAGHDLPFGFTKESLPKEVDRLNEEIAKHPEIADAIQKRGKVWDAIKKDYIKAMKAIGFDVSERFTKENYFRHQVLEYANARAVTGTGQRVKTPTGRGFLKAREGSTYDINSNYLQAEFEVMAQMLYDIEVAKVIGIVQDPQYNIAEKLKAKAEELSTPEKPVDWHSLVPDGYEVWQPREGNVFYSVESVPAQVAQKLMEEGVREIGIKPDDLRKALAMGGPRREFVVKSEVAKTLDNFGRKATVDPVSKAVRTIMGAWKEYQLINPKRVVKYNARNLSGDAEAVFLGNPSTFKKVGQAASELYQTLYGDRSMTPTMRDWFERGGMESTLQVAELGDINQLRMFSKLFEDKRSIPKKMWDSYVKSARLGTDFRESILRYAAYLDYLEQMQKTGKPNNFGASIPEEIMALKDVKDRAFVLSNQLLGAYDQVSVLGQSIRTYLAPFWSWKEVNAKRYWQFVKNAASDGKMADMAGRSVWSAVKRSPLAALRVGKFLIKASALWAILAAYNNLRFPDEEKDLPQDIRDKPHIVLGRDKDGKVKYFDRLGILGDFLEWFGLDAPQSLVVDYLNGRKTMKDIAQEMVKAPINTFWQALGPQYKMPLELVSGQKRYPDVFKPGTIRDKWLYLAESAGLGDEYKLVAKMPSRPYSQTLQNIINSSADPGESSYFDILDEKNEYARKIGKGSDYGGGTTPKSRALYYLKMAVRYGDKAAFEKYLVEYVAAGGSEKGYEASVRSMDPLYGLTSSEKKDFEKEWLDDEGREKLKRAEEFYKTVIEKGEKIPGATKDIRKALPEKPKKSAGTIAR